MSKFKISYNSTEYRFNLHADNGEIIGRSSEGYSSKQSCLNGINSVILNSDANIIDKTSGEEASGSRYEIFYGKDDNYWFRLLAANGENILYSQSYITKQSCKDGISSVKINAPKAAIE